MQNYTVLKKLGTGTYGSAYLVTLKSNPLAQLVLKKVKIEGEGGISADGEVKVLRQLSHPLVLSYVDHFIYKGHLCIVTEYCDAGDLYQLLRARKAALPEAQLLDFFAQVLLAIQHVHGKNILHRDLKTQNIFLTSGGSIRLGDFGISRSLSGTMDLASTIIGTPYYMSPEVMSSMPYDFKSDMWSLGCVLYEMMSLKHAFDAADMSSLVMKILRGEHLPIPQGFSQELKDLVRQLLCKNPKMRPSAEQIMKMPFMKEYVARARETVSQLEGRAGGGGGGGAPGRAGGASNGPRRTDHGGAAGGGPGVLQHRHSHSSGHGFDLGGGGAAAAGPAAAAAAGAAGGGGGGAGSGQLDRELEAAKERLRRIQLEREALLKQAQAGSAAAGAPGGSSAPGNHRYPAQAPGAPPSGGGAGAGGGGAGAGGGGGGSGALSSQHSEPNLIGAGARGGTGAGGVGAAGAGGAGAGGAGAGGVRGASWRDKEEALARLKARSSRDIPSSSHRGPGGLGGGGDVDAQLERHREQRQLRGSRPQSPDEGRAGSGGGGGLSGSPNGGAGSSSMDPRARMKARKEEEARRREAELLNARKAYFEERKQAAARQQQLYQPSTANNHANTNRRATEGSSALHGHHHSTGSGYVDDPTYHSPYARASGGAGGAGITISDSDDDLDDFSGYGADMGAAAAQEFEAELLNGGAAGGGAGGAGPGGGGAGGGGFAGGTLPPQSQLQQALDRGGLAERILALREACAYNLGQPLYELIYGYIRKRMAQGLTDDAAFRSELLARLGAGRMQYVHLIDQLIYFEDMKGLQAALM
ncbi:hypothetical protein HXX76_002232 [Chlamydomonas incerta]|uniref:non-specific serine/threonine protein kinase n=1 Tax=Chlamydomonas incerta TaxID=51695 RepID=A0A835WAQ7_CHLIN|nr:hypothetical protein HXX76_002232 [Chlamydomonas incerta]|eukprot:KAG2443892.1 hypothetical protein HXX76_002232 [Chlamydomonas incerta]